MHTTSQVLVDVEIGVYGATAVRCRGPGNTIFYEISLNKEVGDEDEEVGDRGT
jgi:hypothetical protein